MSDTAAKPSEVTEAKDVKMECDDPSIVTDEILRKKISQIIGFVFPQDFDLKDLKSMVTNPELVAEIDQAISDAPSVKDQEGLIKFFSKDLKPTIKKLNSQGTIYAVDPNAPEVNEVDRIFRNRDQRIERGEPIGIILTEEEHKKHQKEGTLPMYSQRFDVNVTPSVYEPPLMVSPSPLKKDNPANNQDVITSINNKGSNKKKSIGQGESGITQETTQLVVRQEPKDGKQRYCLCFRQNDNKQYIECEDQCDWYHPECIGFDTELIKRNQAHLVFLCPMCKAPTRNKAAKEHKDNFVMVESTFRKGFCVYIP